jgi:uncharacterized membrane protein
MKLIPQKFSVLFWALSGALAWTAHFLLSWAIAEFGCLSQSKTGLIAGSMVILTLLMLVWALFASWHCWRLKARFHPEHGLQSMYYFSQFGILNNLLFASIIVYQSIPIFFFKGACY